MNQEERSVVYDQQLEIEAYHFQGVRQTFPNHFHDYYVIGFIEAGEREMICKGIAYIVRAGDMIFLNPGDSHTCCQVDNLSFDWRCLNVETSVMQEMASQVSGYNRPPAFSQNVIRQSDHVALLRRLHSLIMAKQEDFEKEEAFFFLIKQLLDEFAAPEKDNAGKREDSPVEQVCQYLHAHLSDKITLDDLSQICNMNKYSLLRSFTKTKGITPYRYLETLRVSNAKRLLEQGAEPMEAALQSGFSDQSHFTNFFKDFIGLTPKQYQRIFTEEKKTP